MYKKKVILPLFIISLLVLSTFGIIFSSFATNNTEKIKYNGYRFTNDGNIWFTYKENQRIEFITDPRELDLIDIGALTQKLSTHQKIYISMNSYQNLNQEMQSFRIILNQLFQIPVVGACTQDNDLCKDLPIKDCRDAIPSQVLVIKLGEGNNKFEEDKSCITITGKRDYIIKILEKLKLEVLL